MATTNSARTTSAPATGWTYVKKTMADLEALLPRLEDVAAYADPEAAEEAAMLPAQQMLDIIETLRLQDTAATSETNEEGETFTAPAALSYHSFVANADRSTDCGSLLKAMGEAMARSAWFTANRYGDLASQVRARQAGTNMEIDGEGNRFAPRDGDRDPIAGSDDETLKLITRMKREMDKAHFYGQRALAVAAVIAAETGEELTFSIRQAAVAKEDPAVAARKAAAAKALARFAGKI